MMMIEQNRLAGREMIEQAFSQGNFSVADECTAPDRVDHQETPGTGIISRFQQVVVAQRIAFPDLHFEIQDTPADGLILAMRPTMIGTLTGAFSIIPGRSLPATSLKSSVPPMHFVRVVDGKTTVQPFSRNYANTVYCDRFGELPIQGKQFFHLS